jgi:GAF domain-containing protein
MHAHISQLEEQLAEGGLGAAAEFLNSRVSYRFSTIYHLNNDIFTVVASVDKSRFCPAPIGATTEFKDSFCRFPVLYGSFSTENSGNDPRLKGLAYPSGLESYTGLPLTFPDGGLYGTFCHYDTEPRAISDGEYHFLQQAVQSIMGYLQKSALI